MSNIDFSGTKVLFPTREDFKSFLKECKQLGKGDFATCYQLPNGRVLKKTACYWGSKPDTLLRTLKEDNPTIILPDQVVIDQSKGNALATIRKYIDGKRVDQEFPQDVRLIELGHQIKAFADAIKKVTSDKMDLEASGKNVYYTENGFVLTPSFNYGGIDEWENEKITEKNLYAVLGAIYAKLLKEVGKGHYLYDIDSIYDPKAYIYRILKDLRGQYGDSTLQTVSDVKKARQKVFPN